MSSHEPSAHGLYHLEQEPEPKPISELELTPFAWVPFLKFIVSFLIGAFFFIYPISQNGRSTVAFDIVVTFIRTTFTPFVAIYVLAVIWVGAICTTIAMYNKNRENKILDNAFIRSYESGISFWILRVIGAILSVMLYLGLGPEALHQPGIGGLMWNVLAASVAIIIPIGALFLSLFILMGGLEFVGTLARPIMRPLFRIPGRSALDALASWIGSYSVGMYVTNLVYRKGGYTKRHVYINATCFATVSVGFVGVVAATLDILHLFPWIMLSYMIAIVVTAAITVRIPPLSRIPDAYVAPPDPERPIKGSPVDYIKFSISEAIKTVNKEKGIVSVAIRGFTDGLKLATLIIGTILAVGTGAILLAELTPLFTWLGAPIAPILRVLRVPNPEMLGPATLVGITEMFIPALLVREAAEPARFFIAVLSISQLIFFSAVGPMMLDMFRDIPIKLRDLIVLFLIRTAIQIPLIAIIMHVLVAMGVM